VATLNVQILEAALEDGLITRRLKATQELYIHSSAKTANQIYWAVADSEQGLDSEQLQRSIKVNRNTLFEYTRWMQSKRLIINETGGNKKNLYVAV
jgi:hypothetical protein